MHECFSNTSAAIPFFILSQPINVERFRSRSAEGTENAADYRFPGRLGWPRLLPVLPRTTRAEHGIPAAVKDNLKIRVILATETILFWDV